jgi:hypothetical protein
MVFREQRESFERLLVQPGRIVDDGYQAAREAFAQRSKRLQLLVARICEAVSSEAASLHDVVESMTHMHVNRIHRQPQPYHEYVAYDLLARVYRGMGGRHRQ